MSETLLVPMLLLHALAAVVWVGGMFFAYMALRPAALMLDPPLRLALWRKTFYYFFPWVWLSILILFISGGGLMHITGNDAFYVFLMAATACVMVIIFAVVFFKHYKRLANAVDAQDYPTAGVELAEIRRLIGYNLSLGLAVVAIASTGRYGWVENTARLLVE